jgi:hypothetical protein
MGDEPFSLAHAPDSCFPEFPAQLDGENEALHGVAELGQANPEASVSVPPVQAGGFGVESHDGVLADEPAELCEVCHALNYVDPNFAALDLVVEVTQWQSLGVEEELKEAEDAEDDRKQCGPYADGRTGIGQEKQGNDHCLLTATMTRIR